MEWRARVDQRADEVSDPEARIKALLNAGRLAEANTTFDEVVNRPPPGADRWARSAALVNRAKLAWRLGRIPLALELAAEGWSDLEGEDPDHPDAARATHALAYLLEGIGNRRAAVDMMRVAVGIARRAGEAEVLAICLQGLGGLLNFRAISSQPDVALAAFEEARQCLAEGLPLASDDHMTRALLGAYSRSLAGVGELWQAELHADETVRRALVADDKWALAVGNWVLAVVHRERGDLLRARTLGSRAVTAAESINDPSLLLRFSQDLADICAGLGDPVGEAAALRCSVAAGTTATVTLQEGLGQALEQRRVAVQAQRLAVAAQEAAARDPLTGLANRLGLERAAATLLEGTAARGRVPWLVLVDVDWFKDVNDDAGHAAGDATLREIAQLLRRETRSDDLVARWAGDEFVVLLGNSAGGGGPEAGPVVAERIRAAVDGHDWQVVLGITRRPTVSIGVAAGPAKLDQLFAAADMALYRAKRLGRNRVEVEGPGSEGGSEGGSDGGSGEACEDAAAVGGAEADGSSRGRDGAGRGRPGRDAPRAERVEAGEPEPEQPEPERPEPERPESGQPESGQPEAEEPEAEHPEVVATEGGATEVVAAEVVATEELPVPEPTTPETGAPAVDAPAPDRSDEQPQAISPPR